MPRVLVIDDEPRIVRFLARALSSQGFGVDGAFDAREGLSLMKTGRHELIVLDLMLPDLHGFKVLERILQHSPEQPVLVLTAVSDVAAKVKCLELGASDYMQKPFELAELLARVRARLRRPGAPIERALVAGGIKLELLRRTADSGLGPVGLSEKEFLVLQYLMRREGEVCTREELLEDVWGYSFDPGTNIVDVYVGRLRAKLGSGLIETIRNVGYSLVAAV